MIVVSENRFFHLGIRSMLEKQALDITRDFIVFDTGRDCLYLLDVKEEDDSNIHEPFWFFCRCHRARLIKCNGKVTLQMLFPSVNLFNSQGGKRELLSTREYRVMQNLIHGVSQRKIAEQLNVSEKTISNQKMNALRKLKMENAATFFVEYIGWLNLWHRYKKYKYLSDVCHAITKIPLKYKAETCMHVNEAY